MLSVEIVHTESDPDGTLLVSQAILQHGSIRLDPYNPTEQRIVSSFNIVNGHSYYTFPLGSSILAIPYVFFENLIGNDMAEDESRAQIRLSAIICILAFLINHRIALLYLPRPWALALSLAFSLGSPLISTMGTALWSMNFTALINGLLVLHLARAQKGSSLKPNYIGILLFTSYLCRPTSSLLILSIFAYLYFADRKTMLRAASISALMFVAMVAYFMFEIGSPLPHYYMPHRLTGKTFFKGLYGNLVSPSRGLFVFSPFLIITLFGLAASVRGLLKDKLMLAMIAWLSLHYITVSNFPDWWAGWSYGPRLMTDVMPALFVLTCFSLGKPIKTSLTKYIIVGALLITSLFSIYVNSYVGLFNPWAGYAWNNAPDIDYYPEYNFDWRYPQFMHNEERYLKRLFEHRMKYEIYPMPINTSIQVLDDSLAIYMGFNPSGDLRESDGSEQIIAFKTESDLGSGGCSFNMLARSLEGNVADAYLNGKHIGRMNFTGSPLDLFSMRFECTEISRRGNVIGFITDPSAKIYLISYGIYEDK